jgi:hypothetical protein
MGSSMLLAWSPGPRASRRVLYTELHHQSDGSLSWQYRALSSGALSLLPGALSPKPQPSSFLVCFSERVSCFCLGWPRVVILLPLLPE